MTSVLRQPHTSKPAMREEIEPIEEIEESATEEEQRARRKILLQGGRSSTMLAGITNALKKRMGE